MNLLLCLALLGADIPWSEADVTRPNFTTGFGPLVDDVEQHSLDSKMRNPDDPGNWVHEATHAVNNRLRGTTPEHDGAFYVFEGKYLRLAHPDLTLEQVGAEIPESERGSVYKLYFVDALKHWKGDPLYVLDEAVSYANGMRYDYENKRNDAVRKDATDQLTRYSLALIRAVKKHDPSYPSLPLLEAFVAWNNKRVDVYLGRAVIVPPKPPTPWRPLYGARYHTRNRVRNFFTR